MHKLILFRGHFLPAPIQVHIDRLYEQIDDLVLQLSDERLRHKQTRIRVILFLSIRTNNTAFV